MNEKTPYIIYFIFCIFMFFLGAGVGYYFYIGRIRGNDKRVEQLERTVKEQQSGFAESIKQYESEIRDLKSDSAKAERIVNSMGVQLDSDAADIRRAAELLKTLRNQIMDLQDLYAGNSGRGRNTNLEGM